MHTSNSPVCGPPTLEELDVSSRRELLIAKVDAVMREPEYEEYDSRRLYGKEKEKLCYECRDANGGLSLIFDLKDPENINLRIQMDNYGAMRVRMNVPLRSVSLESIQAAFLLWRQQASLSKPLSGYHGYRFSCEPDNLVYSHHFIKGGALQYHFEVDGDRIIMVKTERDGSVLELPIVHIDAQSLRDPDIFAACDLLDKQNVRTVRAHMFREGFLPVADLMKWEFRQHGYDQIIGLEVRSGQQVLSEDVLYNGAIVGNENTVLLGTDRFSIDHGLEELRERIQIFLAMHSVGLKKQSQTVYTGSGRFGPARLIISRYRAHIEGWVSSPSEEDGKPLVCKADKILIKFHDLRNTTRLLLQLPDLEHRFNQIKIQLPNGKSRRFVRKRDHKHSGLKAPMTTEFQLMYAEGRRIVYLTIEVLGLNREQPRYALLAHYYVNGQDQGAAAVHIPDLLEGSLYDGVNQLAKEIDEQPTAEPSLALDQLSQCCLPSDHSYVPPNNRPVRR